MRRPSRLSGGERERRWRRSSGDETAPFQRPGQGADDPAWTVERVLGPLILAASAAAVVGFTFIMVFARDAAPSGAAPASRTAEASESPRATDVASASRRPLTVPHPSTSPAPTASATPEGTPIPPRSPPTPAPEAFLASVHVCSSVDDDGCVDEMRRVRREEVVVLVIVVENAAIGDTVGFEVSGPAGTTNAGSVTFGFAGDGFAYVEYAIGDLANGQYIVTATRNGAPVASTDFVKRGR
jgi:hypothetical protein